MFAQDLTMSDGQMNLFSFSDQEHGFKRVKKQKCLDCNVNDVELIYNDQSTIYEGLRVCENCRKAFKRRYMD